MAHGMPGCSRNGVVEVGFVSQKSYSALSILRQDALRTQRAVRQGLSVGKGCIRYPRPEKINFAIVARLLEATRDSTGVIC